MIDPISAVQDRIDELEGTIQERDDRIDNLQEALWDVALALGWLEHPVLPNDFERAVELLRKVIDENI